MIGRVTTITATTAIQPGTLRRWMAKERRATDRAVRDAIRKAAAVRSPRGAVTIRFDRGVPADVKAKLLDTLAGLRRLIPVQHMLRIRVVPNPAVSCVTKRGGPPDGVGFGVFVPHLRQIVVASGLAREVQRGGSSRKDGLRAIAETLCHEFVHYEQFRDGKPLTDRNVERRAAALLRRIEGVA